MQNSLPRNKEKRIGKEGTELTSPSVTQEHVLSISRVLEAMLKGGSLVPAPAALSWYLRKEYRK